MDIQTTLAGNLVDDPELRFTNSGQPVLNFRIAHTARRYDRRTGQCRPSVRDLLPRWR